MSGRVVGGRGGGTMEFIFVEVFHANFYINTT